MVSLLPLAAHSGLAFDFSLARGMGDGSLSTVGIVSNAIGDMEACARVDAQIFYRLYKIRVEAFEQMLSSKRENEARQEL